MKVDLNVPLIMQTEKTLECGIACTTMLLHHHGIDTPYPDVKADLPIRDGFGLYLYEIGSYFLQRGFQAEITGFNTHFHMKKHIGQPAQATVDTILEHRHTERYAQRWKPHQDGFDTLLNFLDHGGQLTTKIIEADDITQKIDQSYPVFAALTTNFIYDNLPGHVDHFILLTGHDDETFLANDPGPFWAKGKKQTYLKDDVINGIRFATGRSVEGGMIMTIKPPVIGH